MDSDWKDMFESFAFFNEPKETNWVWKPTRSFRMTEVGRWTWNGRDCRDSPNVKVSRKREKKRMIRACWPNDEMSNK